MRSPIVRLSLFTGTTFAAFGVWLPYWPAWLASRGMSAAQIGTLSAAWSWSRAVSGPLVAHYVDASPRRRPWLIAAAIASVLVFALYGVTASFAAFLVLGVAYAVAQSGTIPLGEGMTVLLAKERGFSYGRVRAFGSAAFLVFAIGAGELIEQSSAAIVQPLTLGMLVVAALCAFAVPEPTVNVHSGAPRQPLREILHSRVLIAALIGGGLVQGSHAAYGTFSTLYWQSAGYSTTTIGFLWAEGVLAEIALFTVAASVSKRFSGRTLLAVGVLGAIVRWLALASSTHIAVLVGTQWMHALSFAAVHLALMNYFASSVAPNLVATASGLYSSTTHASHAVAVALAGFVYERAPGAAFASMSVVALAGGVIAWSSFDRRVTSAQPPRE